MRLWIAIVAACAAAGVLSAAEAKKAEPPDRKAYLEARKIEDPQKKIDALRILVKQYPKGNYADRANDLILDTLIAKFPGGTGDIRKQVHRIEKHAMGSKISRAYQYADLADSLTDGGVLPDEAEKLARKALKAFTEQAVLADAKSSYAAAKMKPPPQDELEREYQRSRAEMTATLGRTLVARGNIAEGKPLLEEACRADPGLSAAAAALGRLALHDGNREQAFDDFTQARLTAVLKPDDQKQFESLYRERHNGDLRGMDAWLDSEYEKRFPGVKIQPYTGPVKRVALAEVFTGAGCPPCAGADAAMDGVLDRYPRKDLAVLMYHQHIPHPDPMANPSTEVRAVYYGIRGVPAMIFDGVSDHGGGANRAEAQRIYERLLPEIDKQLAAPPEAKLELQASRNGSTIDVHATVAAVKSEAKDLKLQVALVEKKLRYSGENGIRFHPMVVRAMCGKDSEGLPIAAANSKEECSFDVAKLSRDLKTYLDDYEQHNERYGKFTFIEEMDAIDPADLAVVAFVEDPAQKHVLAAAYAEAR